MAAPSERARSAEDALPLLFLDVDGPLLPFGGTSADDSGMDGYFGRLDPTLGERLAALPCRLVWATAWEDDANAELAPRLGLPELPVVAWPAPSDERARADDWFGLHWKTRTLVEWADGRAFVWVDDELTDDDRRWVSEHHAGQALLHHVDSWRGLGDEDFCLLEKWLASALGPDQGSSRR